MAEPGSRTVRVSGLPADTEDDRLRDKLFIHFLRARNGGGEIESVTIVRATPVSALITFEDSGVAQRVIQHSRHILEMDGKKYRVTVTEHHERLDPDKVIRSLSAVVDYSQLPGGVMTLTSLHKSHPDIQISSDAAVDLYTLHGTYYKVQAALAQLFGHPEGPQSAENKDSGQPATGGTRPLQMAQKSHTQESEDQKPIKPREQREKIHTGRLSDEYSLGSHRDVTPGAYSWEDTGETEGAALQLPEPPVMSEEDLLLIVDADMFQYLQKHCRKEYEQILNRYGVSVVDMTNQGLTSLFLQVSTGVREDGRDHECLKLARRAISVFLQENETKICRAQLPKSILSPRAGLERAKEKLSVRLPKLLLNEDDRYIYIVGISSDVAEAKQFLLDHTEVRAKKEDVACLLRYPSYDSGSSTADEQRLSLTTSPTLYSVDDRIDQLLRSEEDEREAEGARKYKLAARFKDSGLAALGSRPTDFRLRGGLSSPSRQTRHGPVLGHDVLSETAEHASERVSRALGQNTGGDILFKSGDAFPSDASMQSKTYANSHLIDIQPKSITPPFSTTPSSLPGSTPVTPPRSGSTLRRASSFSGTPQQKAQVTSQKSQDDSGKSTVKSRTRSSSLTGREKQGGYNAEITVPLVMWQHIKEAYSTRVADLTSDVQMKESRSEGSSDLTITLRGASSSKVSSCQLDLQKLVDSVSADFFVQELRFSELCITNAGNETLQAFCAEVRSRFKKVTIQILRKSLFLLGPKQMCSQLGATLREVFSGDLGRVSEQQDFSAPSTANETPSTFLQMNEGQSTSLHCTSNPQVMPESQTSNPDVTSSSREGRPNNRSDFQELVNGSISHQLVGKDPVIKEKVKTVGTVEMDRQQTSISLSEPGGNRSATDVNGVGSATAHTDEDLALDAVERITSQKDGIQQRHPEIENPSEESRSGLGGICVCGENEKLIGTKCGVRLCAKCLDTVHVHCRVCHEKEPPPRGIRGKMSYSKLHITVPGHKKDCAIKITYCIPDGIQEDCHPLPGKPFQGGVFEAFLPDCEKTRKLLPRLEKAFRHGLTFTVVKKEAVCKVTWDCIPHKTTLHGGKSGNGYPDSTYFTRLSQVLTSHGIEEPPAKS